MAGQCEVVTLEVARQRLQAALARSVSEGASDDVLTREQCINWIIDNQLGRRNLTEKQKDFLRGKRYLSEKKAVTNPEGAGGKSGKIADGQNGQQQTSERLAEQYGVSEHTIRRDAKFAEAVDSIAETVGPEARQVLLGSKASKKDIIELAEAPKDIERITREVLGESLGLEVALEEFFRAEMAMALTASSCRPCRKNQPGMTSPSRWTSSALSCSATSLLSATPREPTRLAFACCRSLAGSLTTVPPCTSWRSRRRALVRRCWSTCSRTRQRVARSPR